MNETTQRRLMVARIRTGDRVLIEGWSPEPYEVTDAGDPSLLVLRSPTGNEFKIGRLRVRAVLAKEEELT